MMILTSADLDALEETALKLIPEPPKKEEAAQELPANVARAKKAMTAAVTHFPDHWRNMGTIVAPFCDMEYDDCIKLVETVAPKRETDKGRKGLAIIQTGNVNSHSYVLDRPIFMTGSGHGIGCQFRTGGEFRRGNTTSFTSTDARAKATWRFATAEEIRAEINRIRTIEAAKPKTTVFEHDWLNL